MRVVLQRVQYAKVTIAKDTQGGSYGKENGGITCI